MKSAILGSSLCWSLITPDSVVHGFRLFTDYHSNHILYAYVKSLTLQLLTQSFSRTTTRYDTNLCPEFHSNGPYSTMQRTIHVHQNDNAILRVAFLLVLSFTLTGCALTRVSASSHDKDVDELNVIGLNLDAARQKQSWMVLCAVRMQTSIRYKPKVAVINGYKRNAVKSTELFCPQMRFIVFNVDPDTNKVVDVGKYINQHTCF